jgi:hypothetical protein
MKRFNFNENERSFINDAPFQLYLDTSTGLVDLAINIVLKTRHMGIDDDFSGYKAVTQAEAEMMRLED